MLAIAMALGAVGHPVRLLRARKPVTEQLEGIGRRNDIYDQGWDDMRFGLTARGIRLQVIGVRTAWETCTEFTTAMFLRYTMGEELTDEHGMNAIYIDRAEDH